MANEEKARALINRGLQQRQRRAAVAAGDVDRVAEIDKKLNAPFTPQEAARDEHRRRLIGKGYDHLKGPEITALRERMAAAASITPPTPSSGKQMIVDGLNASRKKPSRHDESFISDWANQGGIRRT